MSCKHVGLPFDGAAQAVTTRHCTNLLAIHLENYDGAVSAGGNTRPRRLLKCETGLWVQVGTVIDVAAAWYRVSMRLLAEYTTYPHP